MEYAFNLLNSKCILFLLIHEIYMQLIPNAVTVANSVLDFGKQKKFPTGMKY